MPKKTLSTLVVIFIFMFFSTTSHAITTDEIIQNLKESQNKIKDQECYYTQTTNSTMFAAKPIIEKGKFYKKDLSTLKKITSPASKIILTTPDEYFEKETATGKTVYKNLKEEANNNPAINTDIDAIIRDYNFQIKETTAEAYLLKGSLKDSTIEMMIDKNYFVTNKMEIFIKGKKYLTLNFEYQMIPVGANSGSPLNSEQIPVLQKMTTNMSFDMGQKTESMEIVLEYKGIKVNQGLDEKIFMVGSYK